MPVLQADLVDVNHQRRGRANRTAARSIEIMSKLTKTGMRAGELCNLDIRDLNLETPGPRPEIPVRAGLDGRPDSSFVASDPARGEASTGEDGPRPTSGSGKRRFQSTPSWHPCYDAGSRFGRTHSPRQRRCLCLQRQLGRAGHADAVHHVVTAHAADAGWYRAGGDREENVTPHYFRHFFTTHLRDRTGDRGIVKYLRGDVAGDIIDTYTHNWGDRVRETYESNIYSLIQHLLAPLRSVAAFGARDS